MTKQLFVVDLFAGAGGLSEGFHRHGFNTIAYVEKDRYACQTLLTRHAYWFLKQQNQENTYYDYLRGDINSEELYNNLPFNPCINMEISKETLPIISEMIKRNMKLCNVKKIDLFIGGPPCQAYSVIGRARDPYNMEKDSRNMLYKYYVKLLSEFKPKMFVFENVPGILSAGKGKLWQDVKKYFSEAGYDIDFKVLNAADFGVLQSRKRVILVGWQCGLGLSYPAFQQLDYPFTVNEIFKDLPSLHAGEGRAISEYLTDIPEYLSVTGIRNERDVLVDHTTRPVNSMDQQIYRTAVNLWKKHGARLKYDDLPVHLKTHKNTTSFIDRFKVVADDLPYSHTMVAHIAKDGHHYIHPDIKQNRSISVREAARIQSFPDNYKFEGSRTAKLRQIGNAVPPLMAEKIASKIKIMIQKPKKHNKTIGAKFINLEAQYD